MRPFLALALLLSVPALPLRAAPATPEPLRIGLDHMYRHSTSLLLSCDKPFTLADALSGRLLAHGAENAIFKVTLNPKGIALARAGALKDVPVSERNIALTVQSGGGSFVQIARMDSRPLGAKGIPWRRYRGFLTVRQEPDNTLRVINTVPLEAYLYGVIPAEIGSDVPLEAMKAQAVAARTYALKNRKSAGPMALTWTTRRTARAIWASTEKLRSRMRLWTTRAANSHLRRAAH